MMMIMLMNMICVPPIYIFYSFPIISFPPSFFFFFLLFTLRYSLSGKKSYHLQKLRLSHKFLKNILNATSMLIVLLRI